MLQATFAIGEGSMNLFAFYVFQEPTYRTVIMAAAVMLTVPWLAHVLGVQLARSSRWTGPLVLSAGVIGSIVVGGLIAINYVRVVYLMELAPDFVARHPSLSLAFLMINLLVFAGSATVSYAMHAPNAATEDSRFDEVRQRYRIKQGIERKLTLWAIEIYEKHRRRGRPVRVHVPGSPVDAGRRSGRREKGPKTHDATYDAAGLVVQRGTGNGNGAEHDTPRLD